MSLRTWLRASVAVLAVTTATSASAQLRLEEAHSPSDGISVDLPRYVWVVMIHDHTEQGWGASESGGDISTFNNPRIYLHALNGSGEATRARVSLLDAAGDPFGEHEVELGSLERTLLEDPHRGHTPPSNRLPASVYVVASDQPLVVRGYVDVYGGAKSGDWSESSRALRTLQVTRVDCTDPGYAAVCGVPTQFTRWSDRLPAREF